MPDTIYNRYDPALNYERHLFRADKVLQAAELNELQSALIGRMTSLGNLLFKDGDLIRDAGCIVDGTTGDVQLQSGALYLAGTIRGIAPAQLVIPVVGTVVIGVYLQTRTITELEDPALLNPAVGTRGYMEPGAARLQVSPVWGWAGDGQEGQFYPVYEVVDGVLKAKEAPPTIDAVSVAIQKYDRDSTGGSYIIGGLDVRRGAEFDGDKQTFIVSAGAARVAGRQVTLNAAVRYVFPAAPDLQSIEAEPHLSAGTAPQRIDCDYGPIASIDHVTITAQRTVAVVHGAIAGGLDPLPDTSVLQIISVSQGATNYNAPADYQLTAGKVDWSPGGAEPAAGSNYQVTYRYMTTVEPTNVDATGFTVAGAVADTLVLVDYRFKVARVDRLCLNELGDVVPIKGVASNWLPIPPAVPANLLLLATLYQRWDASSTLSQDAPRMVPMADLAHVQTQLDALKLLIASQALKSDAAGREAVLKKSMFVDPLLDDSMRDAGTVQTGAIVAGALALPVTLRAAYFGADVAAPATLAHSIVPLVEQTRKTGSMAVNPYQSFAPTPARVTLDPAVDQMTYTRDTWTSSITGRIVQRVGWGGSAGPASAEAIETVSATTTRDQVCRPQTIAFDIAGFAAGETVVAASFDGIAIAPGTAADPDTRPVADGNGIAHGKITIPSNVPVGRKMVQFIGSGGSFGSASYTAASWAEDRVLRRNVTEYVYEFDPPPAPVEPPAVPQAVLNAGDYIEAVITPPEPDPVRNMVNGLYQTYLGRNGEPDGLNYWVDKVNSGVTGAALVATFLEEATIREAAAAAGGMSVWQEIQDSYARYGLTCVGTDPLAQTLVVPAAAHLLGLDLWFSAVGDTDVVVHLRSVATGLPTRTILAHARLAPAQIAVDGTPTRVLFDAPYYAAADEELAVVVMCNDADTALSIAELGKWDGASWITAQPYTIGVLLSSSNNSTWTAHQDKDLQFSLLAAAYTETVRTIDLGAIDVEDATDLMVLGLETKPGAHSTIGYTITLPDATEIQAASNQPLALAAPVTGAVHLHAHLRGDAVASPVLHRGGQLLVGWLGPNGDYVSRAIRAGMNSRVRVIVDALLPSGSDLTVKLKGADPGDAWSAAIPQIATSALDDGWHELTFEEADVDESMVQAKLAAAGTPAARPFVRNVRVMVM